MNRLIYITKADGSKELFEEQKLAGSLERVGVNPETIDEIVTKIEGEMWDGMPTSEIYSRAFSLLRRREVPVAMKYSIRRALMELGPDGFPFEKYISEIFKSWGYRAITNQIVMGTCVEHEMDIVAWNEKRLVMVEAKYHNEFGLKSDLKVALYVKSRFEDLKNSTFEYGSKRKLDEGWLVTNTKFTEQAIKYSECAGLKLIGWNYPRQGNLHQIIEEAKLHPLTCLTTLSNVHKRAFLQKGITLCRDVKDNKTMFKEMGISGTKTGEILDEIQSVCPI